MNKSNSIMEKIQEYQAPSTIVVELQNEGAILVGSLDDTIESGGTIGSTTATTNVGLNWGEE